MRRFKRCWIRLDTPNGMMPNRHITGTIDATWQHLLPIDYSCRKAMAPRVLEPVIPVFGIAYSAGVAG
ncbi:MAG: hypothetical protein C0478_00810 [Planctomyces sp.]|nr:hypothetical protein [Planctomyces sp.]